MIFKKHLDSSNETNDLEVKVPITFYNEFTN